MRFGVCNASVSCAVGSGGLGLVDATIKLQL